MKPGARTLYHARLWPAACRVNGWGVGDLAKRREITRRCMEAVRGPQSDSTSDPRFGDAETTALFVFLTHLASPDDLDASAEWVKCQEDYRTYNLARQADWHERALYGHGRNKLARDRFAGAASAGGGALDTLDPDAVWKRHLTMASRHQKKLRQERAAVPAFNEGPF